MTFLDFCAGIGGISLGLERAGMICKGQVEIDEFCNRVLEKHWPQVPRWRDLKCTPPHEFPAVDLIAGGYPCQPFSNSGIRKGAEDDRHLWPYLAKIISFLRPTWCLFENVVGHISLGLDTVLSDLESQDYSTVPVVIPACAIGAPHQRERVWIVAHANEGGCKSNFEKHGINKQIQPERLSTEKLSHFTAKGILNLPNCEFLRIDDGVPNWLDRIGACGNAVHVVVVEEIGKAILAAHVGEKAV